MFSSTGCGVMSAATGGVRLSTYPPWGTSNGKPSLKYARPVIGRFEKGRSGNPSGRPKARRPDVSAFDIIFDKTLTATQNGVERELSIDEALELQTYQAALKGNRMAVRSVLKMIEKRGWAAQAAISRPGRLKLNLRNKDDLHLFVEDFDKLRWPKDRTR